MKRYELSPELIGKDELAGEIDRAIEHLTAARDVLAGAVGVVSLRCDEKRDEGSEEGGR